MRPRIELAAGHEGQGEAGLGETPAGLAGGEKPSPSRRAALHGEYKAARIQAGKSVPPAGAEIVASADQIAAEIDEIGRIVRLRADDKPKQSASAENEPQHGTVLHAPGPRRSASAVPFSKLRCGSG